MNFFFIFFAAYILCVANVFSHGSVGDPVSRTRWSRRCQIRELQLYASWVGVGLEQNIGHQRTCASGGYRSGVPEIVHENGRRNREGQEVNLKMRIGGGVLQHPTTWNSPPNFTSSIVIVCPMTTLLRSVSLPWGVKSAARWVRS